MGRGGGEKGPESAENEPPAVLPALSSLRDLVHVNEPSLSIQRAKPTQKLSEISLSKGGS